MEMFVAYKSAFQAHSPTDANKLVSKTSSAPDRFPVTKIKQQKKKKCSRKKATRARRTKSILLRQTLVSVVSAHQTCE